MPEAADVVRLRTEYEDRERRLAGSDLYSQFNPANLFMRQSRQRDLLKLLWRMGFDSLSDRRILEVGCGSGGVLLDLMTSGASPVRLHGIDLLFDRLAQAQIQLPHLALQCANAENLPYTTDTFDLVLQFTVFTSILDPGVKANLAQEMLRVLRRPHGAILWYDFWLNPVNRQTRGIRPAEIRSLFPSCSFTFQQITLAPPVARRLVPLSSIAAAMTEKLGFLNSHYLALIRPQTN
ncbi:MAG: class I SAM-dependent methyltransferase [Anaerolineales bacterium]